MKAIIRDTRTNEVLIEIADNLEKELTDNEVQEFLNGYELSEDELENIYIDYE